MDNAFMNMFSLNGKTALITGAGCGIGRAIATGFAKAGASVIACVDINSDELNEIIHEIELIGSKGIALQCDVSDNEQVKEVTGGLLNEHGKIDILVNNAGIGRRSKAEEMTDEAWDSVIDINLKGSFLFCRAIGRSMIENEVPGRIINMASIGGLVGLETGNANYSASKGGMIAMTRALAIEWSKYNILVNAIAPSHTETPLIEKLMQDNPSVEEHFINNIPLGRLANVDEIAGPTIFLASPAASFITGHVLLVDGGHTAK